MVQPPPLVFIALLLSKSQLASHFQECGLQQLLVLLGHVQPLHFHLELLIHRLLSLFKSFWRLGQWHIPVSIVPISFCTLSPSTNSSCRFSSECRWRSTPSSTSAPSSSSA